MAAGRRAARSRPSRNRADQGAVGPTLFRGFQGWGLRRLVEHPEGVQVDGEDRFLLLTFGLGLLAQRDDLADGLHVEAQALGLGELVADVAGERLLLLLQPLDLLDELPQLLLRR